MDIDENKLKLLIGSIVKKIEIVEKEGYEKSILDIGYFITFDNELILTASDGEYGENAFEFVDKEQYKITDKRELK